MKDLHILFQCHFCWKPMFSGSPVWTEWSIVFALTNYCVLIKLDITFLGLDSSSSFLLDIYHLSSIYQSKDTGNQPRWGTGGVPRPIYSFCQGIIESADHVCSLPKNFTTSQFYNQTNFLLFGRFVKPNSLIGGLQ